LEQYKIDFFVFCFDLVIVVFQITVEWREHISLFLFDFNAGQIIFHPHLSAQK